MMSLLLTSHPNNDLLTISTRAFDFTDRLWPSCPNTGASDPPSLFEHERAIIYIEVPGGQLVLLVSFSPLQDTIVQLASSWSEQ